MILGILPGQTQFGSKNEYTFFSIKLPKFSI